MSFSSYNGFLRRVGRSVVLPVKTIKRIVEKDVFNSTRIEECVDFGAGTLFWAKWLKKRCSNTIAVDRIYSDITTCDGIKCVSDIDDALELLSGKSDKMIWMCDVLHHLDNDFIDSLLKKISSFDVIIIKDINCNKRFGNAMNRLHDRLINGEIIIDINPFSLRANLINMGYKVKLLSIRRLWYPHFLLIAKKKTV